MAEAQWREAFSCFADPHLPPGQGTVTTKDLGTLLRALGKSPSQEELQKLFNEVDPSGEGSIDFQTFCRCMKMPLKAPDPESEVLQSFQAFDKNHSGMIATSELTTVMRNFGEALTDDEVDEMMKAAGGCEAQPGQIDYRRFTKILLNPQ
uniref:EF-hand domain-containing protein n=1 Tax=Hemiselmis tepida TaxID=464990 RepID=A0A7S0VLX3_9CRYP|mmetsp:Transcript_16297/g.41223  ORF Transcript_16297/g.41223 Transcript_16297/m.41223 type:complete len:150 (+) Transcript_16297:41-490(+)